MEVFTQILRFIIVSWPVIIGLSIIAIVYGKLSNPKKVNTKSFIKAGIIGIIIGILLVVFQVAASYMLLSQV